jgi:hypothetical protein
MSSQLRGFGVTDINSGIRGLMAHTLNYPNESINITVTLTAAQSIRKVVINNRDGNSVNSRILKTFLGIYRNGVLTRNHSKEMGKRFLIHLN